MPQFSQDHILILPHAEEYRRFFDVSVKQVLDCMNKPDTREGLATDHYTAEKALTKRRLYIYYYLTYPLRAADNEVYAIIDFIGCTEAEQPGKRKP